MARDRLRTNDVLMHELMGLDRAPAEGWSREVGGRQLTMSGGVLRVANALSQEQGATKEVFAYKWQQRDTFEAEAVRQNMRNWLNERYGPVTSLGVEADRPLVLDAGCGAGFSALEYFAPILSSVRYIGVDVSEAVYVAAERIGPAVAESAFILSDLGQLPIAESVADIVFCEGVLHHTDDAGRTFRELVRFLKPGGLFLLYVYRKKGPIREFTDDYIRDRLQAMEPQAAWEAIIPLTKLGRALGELDIEIDIDERIDVLDIPAGKLSLQRFFYWHVCKAFYRPDFTLDEMAHINFDWFAPKNATRHTEAEVRGWCADAGLSIVREKVEPAGISVVARRDAAAGDN